MFDGIFEGLFTESCLRNQTLIAKVYCVQLEYLDAELKQKHPSMLNKGETIFSMATVGLTAAFIQRKIEELN